MKSESNPYNPGAGTPPPELAGREPILKQVKNTIKKAQLGNSVKSSLMLGLRGVGKTVLLNQIDEIAETSGCQTAIFEADPERNLPELLTPQLKKLLFKLHRMKKLSHQMKKAFGLLRAFASAFKVKYEDFEISISNEAATGDLATDLTDLLVAIGEAAQARKTVAVLLIDEVQYVRKEDFSALIMALHKISQRQLPLLFFGAGLPQLAKLAGDAKSYAERLFEYPEIGSLDDKGARAAIVKPAKQLSVAFEDDAVEIILNETDGYPFFLQVWGSHAWEAAKSSPITARDLRVATRNAIKELDTGFFKVRLDRLTERQKAYARAIAEFGDTPAKSGAVAELLGLSVKQAAPIRDEVIKKGMAYSPSRGLVAFTVPKFDEFMRRTNPKFVAKKKKSAKKKKPARKRKK